MSDYDVVWPLSKHHALLPPREQLTDPLYQRPRGSSSESLGLTKYRYKHKKRPPRSEAKTTASRMVPLSVKQREEITYFYFEKGMTIPQTARRVGCSDYTVTRVIGPAL